jgi:hypothetical protein
MIKQTGSRRKKRTGGAARPPAREKRRFAPFFSTNFDKNQHFSLEKTENFL